MISLVPPKRYWFMLALGTILVVVINLLLGIPFVATILVSLAFAAVVSTRGRVRKFFGFFFYLGGVELVIVGVLMILGFGLVGAFSAAASAAVSMFMLTVGPILGALLVAFGVVAFVIGNWIIGGT